MDPKFRHLGSVLLSFEQWVQRALRLRNLGRRLIHRFGVQASHFKVIMSYNYTMPQALRERIPTRLN